MGQFVGTLAVYLREPRTATPRDLELASLLTHTAAIIMARHTEAEGRQQAEAALRRVNDELEKRVTERTGDLEQAMDSLETEMGRRRDLTRRLASVQEDERRRVARDLHDSIGQLLAGLSLAFKSVETAGSLPAPVAERLAEARRVAEALGKEVHALAVRLRPTSLDDIGLEAALEQLVSEWSALAKIPAEFQMVGLEKSRLPLEVETTIYRIVQEALTNVARHAHATRASIGVKAEAEQVTVTVEDDGAGFDPTVSTGRLGLLGMQERLALIGGEMDIESSPGAGTTVLVSIPRPQSSEVKGP